MRSRGTLASPAATLFSMRRRVRGWLPIPLAVVAAGAVVWLLYAVWRSPQRSNLATYGAFAVPVLVLAAGWIGWAWRARSRQTVVASEREGVSRVADRFAQSVQEQWKRAATERALVGTEPIAVSWGRSSRPLGTPLATAVGSQQFAPLPGMARTGQARLVAGEINELRDVYGGLGSGRLIIAGAPGSGKTSAAVVLILAVLKYREQLPPKDRQDVPVPVLFTAHDWDPRQELVADWLTRRLQETYPLFTGRSGAANARALLTAGRVTLILDGLDEIAGELRPAAVQALNQQASMRIVVLSRTAEMAAAAARNGVLQGAAVVELHAVDPAEAARYLQRVQRDPPPDSWRDLIERVRSGTGSALCKALDSPLMLTLVRDTYQSGDDARELLDFCEAIPHELAADQAADKITDHLLDRILPSAYASRPGQPPPRYDLRTAHNALAKIAVQMNQGGTRDLQWWQISGWAPLLQRVAGAALATGLTAGLVTWIATAAVTDSRPARFGEFVGIFAGFFCGLASDGNADHPPRRILRPRLHTILRPEGVLRGNFLPFVNVLMFGLLLWLASLLQVKGNAAGLIFVVLSTLGFALVFLLADSIVMTLSEEPDDGVSPSPAVSWRDDRNCAIMVGGVFWLVLGFIFWPLTGPLLALISASGSGLGHLNADHILPFELVVVFLLAVFTGFNWSQAWPSFVTEIQLAIRWRTPVNLIQFLEDAHGRNILRTVGPVYQFRHARLQDHLARQEPYRTHG